MKGNCDLHCSVERMVRLRPSDRLGRRLSPAHLLSKLPSTLPPWISWVERTCTCRPSSQTCNKLYSFAHFGCLLLLCLKPTLRIILSSPMKTTLPTYTGLVSILPGPRRAQPKRRHYINLWRAWRAMALCDMSLTRSRRQVSFPVKPSGPWAALMAAPWAVILLVLTVLVGIGGLFYSLGPLDDPLKPQISSEPIAHVSAQEPARPPRATLVAMPRAHETEAPVIGGPLQLPPARRPAG
jgi:hypothetical protein